MKSIVSKILALSLKAKIAIAAVVVVGATGASAGVVHHNNEVAMQQKQIKIEENKKIEEETKLAESKKIEEEMKLAESKPSDTTIANAESTTTDTNSSESKPATSTSISTSSQSEPTTTTSTNASSQSKSAEPTPAPAPKPAPTPTPVAPAPKPTPAPTPAVSAYYVAPPSCSTTTYNDGLTQKLWSLKKEESYEGIKAATWDDALKRYGCGDENAINDTLRYKMYPPDPNPAYEIWWNEFGYGLNLGCSDVVVSKYETNSNDAKEILNQINGNGFYKRFNANAATESYFYKRAFICYNPSTKKNIIVRLGIGIARGPEI